MPQPNEIRVLHGDCLALLREMQGGIADLAYLDPPFFTQKVHSLAPRDRSRQFSFADVWESQQEYAEFLHARVAQTHRVMSDRGSIFLHCDRKAVHLARLVLDDVFGSENFRSEIVWHYRRWSNSRRGLLPSHQNLLYYSKTDEFIFNEMFTEYSPSTNVDQILQRRSRDVFNKSVYDRDADGNIISSASKRGVPLGDVWDIPLLNPKAKERTGYPTQKPLLLLERILLLASLEGSLVLDPFCGSGTTLAAAQHLGRSAVGIDVSEEAVTLTKERLLDPIRSESRLLENGRESYRNADEAALSHLSGLEFVPVQRNSGMDAILKRTYQGGPIPVRVQRPEETVYEAAQKLFKACAGKGARIMFVVATSRGGCFEFAEQLPPGVIAVESPAVGILDQLESDPVTPANGTPHV